MPQATTAGKNTREQGPGANLGILFRVPGAGWIWTGPYLPNRPTYRGDSAQRRDQFSKAKKNLQRNDAPGVDPYASLEAAHRLAHLVCREGLVTLEGIRVETALVELVRALEGRHRLVVLPLQREAVAHRDPRLGCLGVDIEHLLREPRERRGALEVPEE
jgi:hypothetical protein